MPTKYFLKFGVFLSFCSLQCVLFLVLEKGKKEKSKEILHKEIELRRS